MNIFVRTQESDLFKYLSDAEMDILLPKCEKRDLASGEILEPSATAAVLVLLSGKLDRMASNEHKIGGLFPGETDLEAGLFTEEALPYHLVSKGQSSILLCPYEVILGLPQATIKAKIQAAINDTLCLKIVRLTHGVAPDAKA